MSPQRSSLYCLTAGVLIILGCNSSDSQRGAVSGSVTLDGEPLEQGSIMFVPLPGTSGSVAAGAIEGGRYLILQEVGAALGTNKVEIRSSRKTGRTIRKYGPHTRPVDEVIQLIPQNYNKKSILKVDVTSGSNVLDFDLTTQKSPQP